jgi:hypothetical protein
MKTKDTTEKLMGDEIVRTLQDWLWQVPYETKLTVVLLNELQRQSKTKGLQPIDEMINGLIVDYQDEVLKGLEKCSQQNDKITGFVSALLISLANGDLRS